MFLFQATIAAAISEKSPFSTPMNRKEEANLAKAALAVSNSDHLTIYNAYLGYGELYRGEIQYSSISIRRDFVLMLSVVSFLSPSQYSYEERESIRSSIRITLRSESNVK